MSELVEKVARALFDIEDERIGSRWEDEDAGGKAYWHQSASAAIAVILQEIKEPSEGMKCAGVNAHLSWPRAAAEGDPLYVAIFRAMLSAFAAENGLKP